MNKLSSLCVSLFKYNFLKNLCLLILNIICLFVYGSALMILCVAEGSTRSTTISTSLTSAQSAQQILLQSDLVTSSVVDTTQIQGWQCHCWNSTFEGELECRCEGVSLSRIPQRLNVDVQKLTITKAAIPLLRHTGLKVYGSSLQDLIMTDLHEFESIEDGSFSHVIHLRSIYISHAPKLKYLSAEVFQGISSTFRYLRIIYCGLLRIPDMRYLSTNVILNMIDLEGNQISTIEENAVRIKTEQLILDNNFLTYIHKSAFDGSEIAKLSFKSNYELKELHKLAFGGIENIQELDLSSTSIEELPTEGLHSLEVLRIENTRSLKTIPSVYHFKNLQTAWLTHPFHCCAFQFPSRHDPSRYKKRQKYLKELKERCINNGFMPQLGSNSNDTSENGRSINSKNDTLTIEYTRFKRSFMLNDSHQFIKSHWNMPNDESHFGDLVVNGESIEETFIDPITGAPVDEAENTINDENKHHEQTNHDFGEFHDTTAHIYPNGMLHAICGKLSHKKADVKCFPMPDELNPCEDVMGSKWLRSSVWIVLFLAILGNISVLIVLFSNWHDVTVPKFLMCHLAFADLCLGIYLLLIAIIDAHSMGEYFNFAYDWQYGIGCKAAGFLTVFASHLSVFTLTMITIERWFAITNAINLNKRIKLKAASIIMILGWIYSILMSTLPLIGVSNYSSTSICLPMEAEDTLDVAYLILIIAINGFAFFIIAICYGQIYFSLGKETRQAARNVSRGEMTVAKKMALLVFTNFACWAPIAFFSLTAIAGLPLIDVAKSKILLVFFYPLNSCADPYLYAILTSQYRKDLFMLLSKFGFCTQRAQQYKLSYSLPTNQTIPMPMIGRNSIPGKLSLENGERENFV